MPLSIFTFWYSGKYLGNIILGSSAISQIGKTVFTTELVTVSNTLEVCGLSGLEQDLRLESIYEILQKYED